MGAITGGLHCHSRHSDGSATVESIVSYAVRLGLGCVALTNHDTMAGVDELYERGRHAGLGTVPGVECSARDGRTGRPVHLLCYLPRDRAILQAALDRTLVSHAETKWLMVERIMESYPITRGDVLRYSRESASVHESHIMQAPAPDGDVRHRRRKYPQVACSRGTTTDSLLKVNPKNEHGCLKAADI